MKKLLLFLFIIFSIVNFAQAKEYKRIISLAPSVTISLYELDLEKNIAGITLYCPKGKYQKELVGTFLEPDLEKIVALRPDLIIASKDGNLKAPVEKLQKIGFEIYVMEAAKNFEEICQNFILLAKKTNTEKTALEIVKKAKMQVAEIYNSTKLSQAKTVFWEIGTKPLYTAGKNSFLNSYNKYSNTKNIYGETIKSAYSPVDIEDVLMRNPDIVLIADMDTSAKYPQEQIKKYALCNAGKNGKVYVLKSDELFGLTPLSFSDELKNISLLGFSKTNGD
ncbi:MAG: helical backbone metal receptor [Elusimicrobiota bacterium]|jgi:iron complex transport system substrate-binding protein|nr:helical backbone metal receptor [Elusimicrobiota bacterium]